jgi:serine/threonine-protein kinase
MQGDRTPFPFLHTRFDETGGAFSPDGRWVSYVSNETGRNEVYVRPFVTSPDASDASGKWIISKDGVGNAIPRWRDDGKQIVYSEPRGMLMTVDLDVGTSVQARTPRPLFQVPPGSNLYTATGDLKRYLIPVPVEQKVPQAFSVMLNWTSVLKTR